MDPDTDSESSGGYLNAVEQADQDVRRVALADEPPAHLDDLIRARGSFTWKGTDGTIHRSTFGGVLLKPREVYSAVEAAGWTDAVNGVIFVATLRGESGFYTEAILEYGSRTDRFEPSGQWDAGLGQLNNYATPGLALSDAFDHVTNLEICREKYQARGFRPWYAYLNGAYRRFWRQAVKGMANHIIDLHQTDPAQTRKKFI